MMNTETQRDESSNFDDAPLQDKDKDRFHRWPFAQQIVDQIANFQTSSSMVLGIYGFWGEGKSTTLGFIKQILDEQEYKDKVHCCAFNPWRYSGESELILDFFHYLADELGTSLEGTKDHLQKWLIEYGKLSSPVGELLSFTGNPIGLLGGFAQYFGGALAKRKNSLETLRGKIEGVLKKTDRKVVVLIDDIDRLENKEIQALFKLVKLTANFPNLIYVLSFDLSRVAIALSKSHGNGEIQDGINFLEKIVQYPLYLPKPHKLALRNYCTELVATVLMSNNILLTESEKTRLFYEITKGIELRVSTPRMCKRLAASISFVVPKLKEEVNVVDLILLESVKAFYPKLYDFIRDNPQFFVASRGSRLSWDTKKLTEHLNKRLQEEILVELEAQEADTAIDMFLALFPRYTRKSYSQMILESVDYFADSDYATDKRIVSQTYYQRYFTYSILPDEVSDQVIHSLLQACSTLSDTEVKQIIKNNITPLNAGDFILKLRCREDDLDKTTTSQLVLAISQLSDLLPDPNTFFGIESPFSQAAVLIGILINNLEEDQHRFYLSQFVFQEPVDIRFSLDAFRWVIKRPKTQESRFSKEDENKLAAILVARVKQACLMKPVYEYDSDISADYIRFWGTYGSKEELNLYIQELVNKDAQTIPQILQAYFPTETSFARN